MAAAAPILTPADLATELGTDARTARKFLRAITPRDEQPGKGARWAIKGTKTNIATMQKKFSKFQEEAEAAKAAREAKKAEAPTEVNSDITDTEDEAPEELDSLEPTDADIEAMMLEEDNED